MNGLLTRSMWIALALVFFQAVGSRNLFAEDIENKTDASGLNNIGFVKNPPKELKEKFPMCDAFLKVEWIDKEKKIGYTHYEAEDGNDDIPGKKYSIWALVVLDSLRPVFNQDIYQFKRKNKMDELIDVVKSGKVVPGDGIYVIGNTRFYDTFIQPVLSEYRQTVCIAYPDEKRAWIIEGKSAEHAFSESQESELITKLNDLKLAFYTPEFAAAYHMPTFNELSPEIVDPLWALDINNDGKPDLVRISFAKDLLIYSSGNRYYTMEKKDHQVGYATWSFPPHQKICELKPYGHTSFLTTDGKNYFLNNQCNLTQLTSSSVKEQ